MAKRTYLKGLPALKRKLIRLKDKTMPAIRPIMSDAADKLVARMKASVPRDSGDLYDSIQWGWGDPPKGAKIVVRAKVDKENSIWISAGDEKAWYVRFVEFGTASHTQGGMFAGTEHPGNPPQPFFFNNYRAVRKQIKKDIRKAIKEAVRGAIK